MTLNQTKQLVKRVFGHALRPIIGDGDSAAARPGETVRGAPGSIETLPDSRDVLLRGDEEPPPAQPAADAAGGGASQTTAAADGSCGLFFARVPPAVTAEQLGDLFSAFGAVVTLNLFKPFGTARTSKGCGIVRFAKPEAAASARAALHGRFRWSEECGPMVIEDDVSGSKDEEAAAAAAAKARAAGPGAAVAEPKTKAKAKRPAAPGAQARAPPAGGAGSSAAPPAAADRASGDGGRCSRFDRDVHAAQGASGAAAPFQQLQQQQLQQQQLVALGVAHNGLLPAAAGHPGWASPADPCAPPGAELPAAVLLQPQLQASCHINSSSGGSSCQSLPALSLPLPLLLGGSDQPLLVPTFRPLGAQVQQVQVQQLQAAIAAAAAAQPSSPISVVPFFAPPPLPPPPPCGGLLAAGEPPGGFSFGRPLAGFTLMDPAVLEGAAAGCPWLHAEPAFSHDPDASGHSWAAAAPASVCSQGLIAAGPARAPGGLYGAPHGGGGGVSGGGAGKPFHSAPLATCAGSLAAGAGAPLDAPLWDPGSRGWGACGSGAAASGAAPALSGRGPGQAGGPPAAASALQPLAGSCLSGPQQQHQQQQDSAHLCPSFCVGSFDVSRASASGGGGGGAAPQPPAFASASAHPTQSAAALQRRLAAAPGGGGVPAAAGGWGAGAEARAALASGQPAVSLLAPHLTTIVGASGAGVSINAAAGEVSMWASGTREQVRAAVAVVALILNVG